jgi:hypothetical protein
MSNEPWYKEDYTAMTYQELEDALIHLCSLHPRSMNVGEKIRAFLWEDYQEMNS